tara:strand:+ start:353 stop:1036 length:684 start_codon:yes stop_codon:yes gene_type:complete
LKNKNKTIYIDFSENFDKEILSCITISNNLYDSKDTLDRLLNEKKISFNKIAYCEQIHSDSVVFIDKPGIYYKSDGLVAKSNAGIFLKIQTADCAPIFIYDPKSKLIGLVHSGWKGTQKSISKNAIDLFIQNGSSPKNIKVFIGPLIKKCCYEVKNNVSSKFDDKYIFKNDNKLFLDLESKIVDDLLLCGLNLKNIKISKLCTFENQSFHSFRRTNNTKRMYSLIGV